MANKSAENLIIVESPTKTHTLGRLLGKQYKLMASVGHVSDLPVRELGVDVDKGFAPTYVTIRGKAKVLAGLKKAAAAAERVYLAPDPDREGEAIAWHVAQAIDQPEDKVFRITFDEITRRGVEQGLAHPRKIDMALFEAQQARRILDRLVGYKISPLLWRKIRRGLSAGRVQSVAVRLICEREAEIRAFVPQEYWSIDAEVEGPQPPPFPMALDRIRGQKAKMVNAAEAQAALAAIGRGPFAVLNVEKKEVRRHPLPPFITSTLQQDAARKLRFTAKRTMSVAQRLYEGVDLGGGEVVGLITYMRTDSTRIAGEALDMAREHIAGRYAPEYLPERANIYKTKKSAQDAHEAIRPTDVSISPESLRGRIEPDQQRLYELIWKRFIASQMTSAVFEQTRVEASPDNRDYLFVATGQVQKFPGFLILYEESSDDNGVNGANGDKETAGAKEDSSSSSTKLPLPTSPDTAERSAADQSRRRLPSIAVGDSLTVLSIAPNQHFTQPPPRFTEATLVRELERLGIGRPSTYAAIISVIQDKEYVAKDKGRFAPTELGEITNGLLVESFPKILDAGFTAEMENKLDDVEEGKVEWHGLLADFYRDFEVTLKQAAAQMKNLKAHVEETDIACDKCGKKMVIRWGRNGKFLACSGYPACKNAKDLPAELTGKCEGNGGAAGAAAAGTTNGRAEDGKELDQVCPKCGSRLVIKTGRNGRFAACPKYPACKHAEPIRVGVKCPRHGCDGELVERYSAKKRARFYSCNRYPECRAIVSDKPVANTKCERCGHPFLVEDPKAETPGLKCPAKGCSFRKPIMS